MEPISDPSMIPPPLRSPKAIPNSAAPNTNAPLAPEIGRKGPEVSGMIAAVAALMLILTLILSGLWMGGKSDDSNPIGGQVGEPITEGLLADKNGRGSSLDHGLEEPSNNAMKPENKATDKSAEEKNEIAVESEMERKDEPEDSSEGNRKAGQNEVSLAMVPNRQNSADGNSHGNPSLGSPSLGNPGNIGGLDLDSTKGFNPFVGEGKPALSTVFVIDVSGSMWSSNSIPRVMNALNRAIDELGEKQTFCVLLFDQGYYSAPFAIGLIPGVKGNKLRIKQWLSHPPGGGGTDPMAAMAVAIGYKPERIVLLSDGEFDPTYCSTITTMNNQYGKSARIDCVGLLENVLVLREIADRNNGIYYQAW